MNLVFLDASAIIYLLEGKSKVRQAARQMLAGMRSKNAEPAIVVSALSRLECRVQPIRNRDQSKIELFDRFFADPGLHIVQLSPGVIEQAAHLRANHGLKTPDALQAACTLELAEEPPFLTGDSDFRKIRNLDVHLIQ